MADLEMADRLIDLAHCCKTLETVFGRREEHAEHAADSTTVLRHLHAAAGRGAREEWWTSTSRRTELHLEEIIAAGR